MIKSAVIGDPISHSLSPKLHNFLLKKYNIKGSYEAIKVAPQNLEKDIDSILNDRGFSGFNATIPHKEKLFELCVKRKYKITDAAQSAQAVNTIYQENGEIVASNSDIFGFQENLRFFGGDDFMARDFKKAVIVGAGGAAKAAVFALLNSGFGEILIMNRTVEKARKLCDSFAVFLKQDQRLNICEELPQGFDLLVNTTSLGMIGQKDLDLDLSALPRDAIIYDIVYNPLMTSLLKKSRAQGNQIITGIGMLIFQAFEGFEKWFGVKPELTKDEFFELCEILIGGD